MVLCVTLRDVLDERAIIRQKVTGNVDSLGVPDFAIFQAVLRRVQYRQEPQLCSDAEVRNDHVKNLVQQLVLTDLLDQVLPDRLLQFDIVRTAVEQPALFGSVLLENCLGALGRRDGVVSVGRDYFCVAELVEAERL